MAEETQKLEAAKIILKLMITLCFGILFYSLFSEAAKRWVNSLDITQNNFLFYFLFGVAVIFLWWLAIQISILLKEKGEKENRKKQTRKEDSSFKEAFLIIVAAYAGASYSTFTSIMLRDYSNLVTWIGFIGANFVLFGAVWILIKLMKD